MDEIVAENGQLVTDEMIENWENALEHDEWPSDWANVGEIIEGRQPKQLLRQQHFSSFTPKPTKE